MTSDDLAPEQAGQFREQIAARLRWANRLLARMERRRWDPRDEMYRAAKAARDGLQDLATAAHYASSQHGVGKPAKEVQKDGPP